MASDAVIQFGSNDVEVKTLQRQLKRLNRYPGNIDGLLGPMTDAGVKNFQEHLGRVPDGKVDPDIKQALGDRIMWIERPKTVLQELLGATLISPAS